MCCLDCRGVNDIATIRGRSLLQLAIIKHMPDVALAILAHPQLDQVNQRDSLGSTALHAAALYGYAGVCREILARGDFTEVVAESDNWTGPKQGPSPC